MTRVYCQCPIMGEWIPVEVATTKAGCLFFQCSCGVPRKNAIDVVDAGVAFHALLDINRRTAESIECVVCSKPCIEMCPRCRKPVCMDEQAKRIACTSQHRRDCPELNLPITKIFYLNETHTTHVTKRRSNRKKPPKKRSR